VPRDDYVDGNREQLLAEYHEHVGGSGPALV
jgi:hypothetical protein